MTGRRANVLALALSWVVATSAAATRGAVATEHRVAADAGAAMLRAGGSAADAAIATAASVCVVHPSSCGIGGGGFALVWRDGAAHALDFREVAPGATRAALYSENGVPQSTRSRTGGLAVGVPGEVAGWIALHERFGRLPLAVVLAPAIRLAREGFRLADSPHLARQLERLQVLLRADPGLAAIFLDQGKVPGPDFRVRQGDLARTLEAVAAHRRAAVYAGPTADGVAVVVDAHGGVLAAADLAHYLPVWRRPLTAPFAGRTIVTFPPPGSGGIVLTVLGIVDGAAPLRAGRASAEWPHLLAGALAQGFADRARWYGDPAFTTVPLETLLAPTRLARLRAEILAETHTPPRSPEVRDAGTAHVSVIDDEGSAVALTTTINTGFGAGLLVPGTGMILNNEMDDFVLAPGAVNVYGLDGGTANVIGPNKRPQSSMSPTIVVRDGRPELVVGASGGPFIISSTVQVLLGVLAFGRDVPAAVADARLHDQGAGAPLLVEPGVLPATRHGLARGDRRVVELPDLGAVAAVGLTRRGTFVAAADPRKDGGAVVVP